MSNERDAGYELLKSAALANFEVVDTQVGDLASEGSMRAVLQFEENDVEWAALGFIFAIAVLSFTDARPAGHSDIDYAGDDDEFRVLDLVERLRYEDGRLHLHVDYLRGRLVKTTVHVHPDGEVVIQTVNRGRSLGRWLDLLMGKKHLVALAGPQEGEA